MKTHSDRSDYTVEEYIALLEEGEQKYEYDNGRIYLMAGAKPPHNRIQYDLIPAIAVRSRDAGCRGFGSDQAVWIELEGRYVFPDLVYSCEPEDKFDQAELGLVNPSLIIEILSKRTEKRDRGEKFDWYRSIPSFREYVLIDSRSIAAQGYYRHDDGRWTIQNHYRRNQSVRFHTLGIEVPLNEIYQRVHFEEEE